MITAGETLKQRRLFLNKTLEAVSQETKIQRQYLIFIESNQFDKFDSPVFVNGFIKIYASYLGLNVEKILALYRRSTKEEKVEKKQPEKKKDRTGFFTFFTPQIILGLITAIFLTGILGYIGYQFYNFQKPPLLSIESPKNNVVVETDEINIKGETEENTSLTVNDRSVRIESDKSFTYKLKLSEGKNTVIIKAVKNSNKKSESIEALVITYEPKAEEVTEDSETPEDETTAEQPQVTEIPITPPTVTVTHKAKITVSGQDTWLSIEVDGVQEFAGILKAGQLKEYEPKNTISIVTGKPQTTQLFLDDKEQLLFRNTQTGVASATCRIVNNNFNCTQ